MTNSSNMRWEGHVARMAAGRILCRVMVRKPEGKRPVGRPTCGCEDNIKMNLRKKDGGCGWNSSTSEYG
jgi:hypothetical protein